MITTSKEAFDYVYLLKKRIPELEPIIMKDPMWAYYYTVDIIKGRWLEAESVIMKDYYWANEYLREIPEARTPSKDVPLVLGYYAIMDIPNTITDEQLKQLLQLIEPNINICHTVYINTRRVFHEPVIKKQLQKNKLKLITIKQLIEDPEILRNLGYYNKSDFH